MKESWEWVLHGSRWSNKEISFVDMLDKNKSRKNARVLLSPTESICGCGYDKKDCIVQIIYLEDRCVYTKTVNPLRENEPRCEHWTYLESIRKKNEDEHQIVHAQAKAAQVCFICGEPLLWHSGRFVNCPFCAATCHRDCAKNNVKHERCCDKWEVSDEYLSATEELEKYDDYMSFLMFAGIAFMAICSFVREFNRSHVSNDKMEMLATFVEDYGWPSFVDFRFYAEDVMRKLFSFRGPKYKHIIYDICIERAAKNELLATKLAEKTIESVSP